MLAMLLALALAAEPRAVPARPDVSAVTWSAVSGLEIATLAPGSGRAAQPGDRVSVELTLWAGDGTVLDSSTQRALPEAVVPGAGGHHPAVEAAVIGVQPGETRVVRFPVAEGQPPVLALLEVRGVAERRAPPAAPTEVAADRYTATPNGLRWVDLAPGTGDVGARTGDDVVVDYTGWLVDGTMFDSSLLRAAPFRFKLGYRQVIQGWDEGVKGMRPGQVRQLVIPGALAYGKEGSPPRIPPDATLVFEVRLIEIRPR